MREKMEEDRNKLFLSLAERCKMGDTRAMADLAAWFRHDFSEEEETFLNAYENNPNPQNLEGIKKVLKGDGNFRLRAYMMWIVRAALYGNEKASRLMERCSYYSEGAYLPRYMFLPGKQETKAVWSSEYLYRLGFIDFDFKEKDCDLFSPRWGYYTFRYVSFYDPPDDDGFGMEIEYDKYYFDEFFCRIPVQDEHEIPKALAELKSMREYYWECLSDTAKTGKFHHYIT